MDVIRFFKIFIPCKEQSERSCYVEQLNTITELESSSMGGVWYTRNAVYFRGGREGIYNLCQGPFYTVPAVSSDWITWLSDRRCLHDKMMPMEYDFLSPNLKYEFIHSCYFDTDLISLITVILIIISYR